ncbi:MAG: IctB family putative bicarbonate transporter [Oscillatoria sp. PMC 1051.18]|nr:IctB family putative bicarbonate transporter [Oscillatoria sp. PMC 1050.18]MEC5033118.1 IctB family putative bicarbonate transporter [Oscillatoria sp. PMC 1051.18]
MNAAWQTFTLSNLRFDRWRGSSYLYKLVGWLRLWREGSWLLQWAEPIGALLISLVIGLSPFVSTSLIGVLLIACAGYWMLLTVSDDTPTAVTPIHVLVLLYWAIATVATAFSPVKSAAFSGWEKLTLYLLLFALGSAILRHQRLRSWIVGVYLHVALLVSLYGIRQERFGVEQLATWNDPTSELAGSTRVYSYLGNPNLLAGYLMSAIALSLAAVFVWRRLLPRILAVTMVLVNSACLYYTDSRGGWMGMLALLLTFGVLLRFWWDAYLNPFWRKWLLPLVFGTMAGVLLLGIALVEPLRLRVMTIFAGREDSSNNFRFNVWEAVFEMIGDRPIIGIGPGNDAFNKIYPLYMRPKYTALSAYSIFLEIVVETGFIGFAVFLWLIVVTYNQGVRLMLHLRQTMNREAFWLVGALAAMSGMLAQGLFDTVWYRPQINVLWWLMVAIVASFYYRRENLPERR